MNRTFTLCFLLYPIALPFGYVLVYTFYHYAVPDANSDLKGFHVYTNLSDLGLLNDVTVNDILSKMSKPSIGIFYVLNDNIKNLPITTQANLMILKGEGPSDVIERSIWTGQTYFGKYGGTNKVESWVLMS